MNNGLSLSARLNHTIALVQNDIGGRELADLMEIAEDVAELEWRMEGLDK